MGKVTRKHYIIAIIGTLLAFLCLGTVQVSANTMPSNPRINGDQVTWDCIEFGKYMQIEYKGAFYDEYTDEEKSPIKWRVLSVNGNDAFLMADRIIDNTFYGDYEKPLTVITWAESNMRSYLNGYDGTQNLGKRDYTDKTQNFLDVAFSDEEQDAILTTKVVTPANPKYGTAGGNDTNDKIYLLSAQEAVNTKYGFASDTYSNPTRLAGITPYVQQRVSLYQDHDLDRGEHWALRTPGIADADDGELNVVIVPYQGGVRYEGSAVYATNMGIRPVLHLDLSKTSLWKNAGTTTCSGFKEAKVEKKITNIRLSASSSTIAVGKKITIMVTITPKDATSKGLSWTSSNTKYATVDNKGVVTTKKAGKGKTVTITATAKDGSNVKATYKIKIAKGAVKKVKLSGKTKVKAGKSIKLKAKVTASKGAYKKLIWTSSNTKYATVSSNGKVKTKKAGKGKTVKITAKAKDGTGKKASKKIKIK